MTSDFTRVFYPGEWLSSPADAARRRIKCEQNRFRTGTDNASLGKLARLRRCFPGRHKNS